ncbi:hypothetical protein MJG53_013177 [Ovis ammon polii x Ovis aries]|uniref:Uncharacterized protein n=1 Tax=Ovis ammon polii x Ovis aries TaxID=2918886 RepID=A0ACB9UHU2_9CETA|nr:hypothetical protein MJT46_012821 [Ovis ammon polii x Ovis aries]KAI4571071.1 hypothetical protein MJG53_013177 [Ovis ammon polii x Ovis aries]
MPIHCATRVRTVFSLAVVNKAVNLTDGFPYISVCGNVPPQSCIFSQVLNVGAASVVVLHSWSMRSVSAICEWVVAMLLFILFGLLAVDFSRLDGCTLCLQPDSGSLRPPPDSPTSLHVQL